MMDTPDNPCLEYFSSEENCIGLRNITYMEFQLISAEYETSIAMARCDIAFSDIESESSIIYMALTFEQHNGEWIVTYYDFEG